jgi:hypothetical protein
VKATSHLELAHAVLPRSPSLHRPLRWTRAAAATTWPRTGPRCLRHIARSSVAQRPHLAYSSMAPPRMTRSTAPLRAKKLPMVRRHSLHNLLWAMAAIACKRPDTRRYISKTKRGEERRNGGPAATHFFLELDFPIPTSSSSPAPSWTPALVADGAAAPSKFGDRRSSMLQPSSLPPNPSWLDPSSPDTASKPEPSAPIPSASVVPAWAETLDSPPYAAPGEGIS